ncbi:unnamed protein product [Peronospora belbahrii]|uniref:Uncharacterized protein n=1 Tax=Peronospora belbahrii TaxID=622444 RepID=A0ABN8CMR0_9STRA|nr:unnamed protein product [Peronospora belbahrii]
MHDVQEVDNDQLQWQSADHVSERRMMVQRVVQLSRSHSKSDANSVRAVLLAEHIELALYSRAGSLMEYCNLATLRRRLQSLFLASSVYEAVANETVVQTRKRRIVSRTVMQGNRMTKRRRCTGIASTIAESIAATFLSSCVLYLTMEVAQLTQGLASNSSMLWLTNLQQLVVHQAGALSRVGSATTPLYARSCAELPVNELNDGESAVAALATALNYGTFPHLKKLQLISVFVNTIGHNGLFPLCNALGTGCCPFLEDVLLAGNNLGNLGAYRVARLLLSPQAPCLVRLNLRRNFIGETGDAVFASSSVHGR